MSEGFCASGTPAAVAPELGETIHNGRNPDLTIDENCVEKRNDEQFLYQAQKKAVKIALA